MVAIRLTRTGAKKKPAYRVVAVDKRRPRDTKTLEILGHYNPRLAPIELNLQRERIDYWLGVGAQPSDTVRRLIKHFDEHGPNVQEAKRAVAQKTAAEAKPAAPPAKKPEAETAPKSEEKAAEPEAASTAAPAEAEPEQKTEAAHGGGAEAETEPETGKE
jgi:small subunit ribosomal protein S16